jgi:hypothetical protein
MFSVGLGVACLAAFWIGGQPGSGLWALGVMLVFALLFAVGGRFDLIRGLRGDGRDEYWARIDVHATALSGIVVISAVIVMSLGMGLRVTDRRTAARAIRRRRVRARDHACGSALSSVANSRATDSPARLAARLTPGTAPAPSQGQTRMSFVPWRKRRPCALS